ncbi:alpha/beta hydrolase [Kitasatospora sp. NBC_00240]|uniref:alpha/beta fold hydrolase n=1 Tax=Kitasatospora sp. NBC_00240 TaxID=2903567 RepID=UPI002258D10C|nr:alpha/beta hydrolase [Kitasatospora sp. NBC_00240]MCX5214975.1 alpha/beta hydrolase [Kitasatospora sp. NBC_00240]
MDARSEFDGWDIHRFGPPGAAHRVLLLPGGLCTTVFLEDVTSQPVLAEAGVAVVAVTLPGFGRTATPEDLSVENYARLLGGLAAELGCDLVAGHSLGANVAMEMAIAGEFGGPVLLLDPSFSREDEAKDLATLDRIGRVPGLGALAWAVMLKLVPRTMDDSFPPGRRAALSADLRNNAPGVCRRLVRQYFAYLDRQGSLAARLCASGARAWIVRGDRTEIGLTEHERRALEAGPNIRLVTVSDSGHLVVTEQPAQVAQLILDMLGVPAGR